MFVTTRAIVLRTIRHGDHALVLKAYTEQFGLRSYLVHVGRKSGVRVALLQPMNRLELVVGERAERDLQQVREARMDRVMERAHNDPVRNAVLLFVQEVGVRVLREEAPDRDLFTFMQGSLDVLDTAPDLRHYPLIFLLQLSRLLGFFPEEPREGEEHFDLREGHFSDGTSTSGMTIGPPLGRALALLLPIGIHQLSLASTPQAQRRELLDHLMLYYRLHLEGMGELRSPAVLKQVLD